MHPSPSPEQEIRLQRALDALPMPLQQTAVHLLESWPGRVVTRTAWNLQRIEIFDRAMTVAAQLFTSIFPILILLASWSGNTGRLFTDTLAMPPEAESQVDLALKESSSTAFGVVGAVIVLVSATSLSRALARAFAKVWSLPKPTSSPKEAWRWVAVVLGIALSLVALRRSQTIADGIPPPHLWAEVVALALLVLVAGFTPWVLLKGVVSARALATGAALFGVVMLLVRPVTEIWLARALESSATRYGSIGVAFTYLAWLYVIAWILLATAVLGQVLVTDDGRIGRFLAGGKDLVRLQPTTSVSSSGADADADAEVDDPAPQPAD